MTYLDDHVKVVSHESAIHFALQKSNLDHMDDISSDHELATHPQRN